MPRSARLDAPGDLHHIMIRGIERRKIFMDDKDREDFLARLERLMPATGTLCFAWAFMPHHAHFWSGFQAGSWERGNEEQNAPPGSWPWPGYEPRKTISLPFPFQ